MRIKFSRAVLSVFLIAPLAAGTIFLAGAGAQDAGKSAQVQRGQGAFNDWGNEQPGKRYLIKASDLPKPYVTESFGNQSEVVPRPADAWPKVPEGFKIDQALTGLDGPRTIVTAPNGDLFIAESNPGRIRVIRGFASDGKVETSEVFASGLTMPYGIAFYPVGPNPQYVYIGNTNSIVRFPYKNGDLKASGPAETIVASIPGGAQIWRRALDTKPGLFQVTERNCWSASAPSKMSAMMRRKPIAPMFWNLIPTDRASEFTLRESEIPRGWRLIQGPANCGLR